MYQVILKKENIVVINGKRFSDIKSVKIYLKNLGLENLGEKINKNTFSISENDFSIQIEEEILYSIENKNLINPNFYEDNGEHSIYEIFMFEKIEVLTELLLKMEKYKKLEEDEVEEKRFFIFKEEIDKNSLEKYISSSLSYSINDSFEHIRNKEKYVFVCLEVY